MVIVPYVYIKDHWSISYENIKKIWDLMVEEKTAQVVFCAGTVKSFEEFYSFLQDNKNCVITVWDDDNDVVMISWLNNFNQNSAAAHFNCFKKVWGNGSEEVYMKGIEYYFTMPFLDTIIGTVPENNQKALAMSKRCGGIVLGTIPNFTTDVYKNKKIGATILYFER